MASGPEHRRDARREPLLGDVDAFQHARPRPVVIHLVLEDDEDHREAEAGHGADGLHARRAGEAGGQRIGDLVVDILRRTAGPVGEDDDLLLADVGDGIDRRVRQRVVAAAHDGPDAEHDEEARVSDTSG